MAYDYLRKCSSGRGETEAAGNLLTSPPDRVDGAGGHSINKMC